MLSNDYRPGLYWVENYPILKRAAAPFKSRKRPSHVGDERTRSRAPLLYPENMIRWTAKFLLLVLLAGTFAPMAAAYSMAPRPSDAPMPADHCQRKPVAAPAMAGCHHHAAATPAEPARAPLAVRSENCCDGHECCRSMVCLSVNVGPRPTFTAIERTQDHVAPQHTSFLNRDFVSSHSVRGPPAPDQPFLTRVSPTRFLVATGTKPAAP